MAAFPGLFSLGEWLGLDVREFAFWVRQSRILVLEDEFRMLQAARVARAEPKDYKSAQASIERRINDLRGGVSKEEKQARGWDALGQLARKQGKQEDGDA